MASASSANHTQGLSQTGGSNHAAGTSSSASPHATTANSGGYGSPAEAAMLAQRQLVNQQTLTIYASALCALILLFTVIHWTRVLATRSRRSFTPGTRNPLEAIIIPLSRRTRNVLVRKVTGFKSVGHGLLVTTWVAVNAIITFTNVDFSSASNVASRFGWMTAANLCFVVFLSLKNTPLAFLTAYSYERINNLHQIAGCTMFTFMCLHCITYTSYFSSAGKLSILTETPQIAAIVAGFSFLSVFCAGMFIRHIRYELFYGMHVLFFMTGITCVGIHQPSFGKGIVIIMLFAASMWSADRIFRASRVLYYSANNEATVYPLPNGGTRVVLKKTPARTVPGKHCFVWIPAIRVLQMHPFTIAGSKPLEFFINSYDGFTRSLHQYAVDHPGAKLRASVDGPYGTFPDPMEYDKIILIAGGSGASFTFGLAVNLLERMGQNCTKNILFIWAVRSHENLSWFADHLNTLRTHSHSPKVKVSLYVTRLDSTGDLPSGDSVPTRLRTTTLSSQSSGAQSPTGPDTDTEKASLPRTTAITDIEKELVRQEHRHKTEPARATAPAVTSLSDTIRTNSHADLTLGATSSGLHHAVTRGRPDAAAMIREAVAATPRHGRVLVAACGPTGLMSTVRNTAAACITPDGPGVEVHCEQFGW